MKKLLSLFLAVSCIIVWEPAVGQSILNKYQKTAAPVSQLQAQQGINARIAAASTILQNMNSYLSTIGFRRNTGTAMQTASVSGPLFAAGASTLSLPSPMAPSSGISTVVRDNAAGTPRLIEMKAEVSSSVPAIATVAEKETAALKFLASNSAVLNIQDPANEFTLKETITDALQFTNCKFTQTYQGLEVWGREFIVHFDARGALVSATGNIEKTPAVIQDVTGTVSQSEAVHTTLKEIAKISPIVPVPQQAATILKYSGPTARKVIWYDTFHVPRVAWAVEARSGLSGDWFAFIDANTGAVLNSYNAVCFDGSTSGTGTDLNGVQRSFKTYQVGTSYYMLDATQPMYNAGTSKIPDSPVGGIMALDLRNADLTSTSTIYYVGSANNSWTDASAVSAHYNAAITYKYYLDTYGRNSVDDKGMTIYSVVHVTESGKGMDNAFWSGQIMCYGDGLTSFKPLAGGLDVAAHEMTHGVTQYTANLEYQGQSGALNESMSDVFGSLVDTLNWTMGEQIIKDKVTFPAGVLRNMADPHNGVAKGQPSWQPAKMSEIVSTTGDNGGVHTNSGIPNKAFYLTATAIGRQKAGKIYYRALGVYLTRSSQFIDARIGLVKAATDLYGATSAEVTAVKNAWDGVEVFDAAATPPPPATVLSGNEWVLLVNTDPADVNSVYMAKTTVASGSDFFALSKSTVSNRPAVSDVSGIILFVDGSHNLRAVNANAANPGETVLDNSGTWESVSVGPGLGALALTSKFIDTTIYYVDLVKSTVTSFKIATKAFDAADKKTALYADALSFDPTGRYILFDCYNETKNASGGTNSFWNINILDVTTGNLGVVFPPLSAGLSVGNPSFSKTSGTRFAFDYVNETSGQATMMAADFNTGDVGTVTAAQNVIGYPSYSADDKTIAYHTSQTTGGVAHHAIEQMPLKADFISGTGVKKTYIVDATYPVWFIVGKRTTDVENAVTAIPAEFSVPQNYPNPFNPSTTITYALPKEGNVRIGIYTMLGSRVAELVNETKSAGTYTLTWNATDDHGTKVASGIYLLKVDAGVHSQIRKMVLLK